MPNATNLFQVGYWCDDYRCLALCLFADILSVLIMLMHFQKCNEAGCSDSCIVMHYTTLRWIGVDALKRQRKTCRVMHRVLANPLFMQLCTAPCSPFSPATIPYFCNYAWQAGTFHPCQFLPRIPPPQNKAHQIASLSKSHQTLYISQNTECLFRHSTLVYTIHMYYFISMWILPNVYLLPAECAF